MRIDQNQFIPKYDTSSRLTDGTSDIPFLLDDNPDKGGKDADNALDTTVSGKASANVSAALWQISDAGGIEGSTSSVEYSAEGTAKIQAMLGESSDDILDQFLALAQMTPAERIRAEYLKQHHVTEDRFGQLPSDQQDAMNKEIADQIKKQLGIDEA